MPGIVGTGGVTGDGARLIMRLQSARGQAIRCEDDLQMSKQLHGHRTYFLPGGAFLIGWKSLHHNILIYNYTRIQNVVFLYWINVGTLTK